mgnify:CR=1 FL=1
MPALNMLMREHLARGWREDLSPNWRRVFRDIEPSIDGLPDWDVPTIFPRRLDPGFRVNPEAEVPGRHMLRAFDGIAPSAVRVVILGQDPYPRQDSATGRAFEDGAWDEEEPEEVATSLRRLLQSAAALKRPDLGIAEQEDDWGRVCQAIRDGELLPPSAPGFFDSLTGQNVLCINAAWTFTGSSRAHLGVNIRVWRPVVNHLILKLIRHADWGPTVFLLLGRQARNRFRAATWRYLRAYPARAFETVYCAHPAAWTGRTYFEYENPLTSVNQALLRLRADPIQWWPPLIPAD